MYQPCLQKPGKSQEAEAKTRNVKCSNSVYRKQEEDAKHQKCLDPDQRQKEAAAKCSNLAYRKQEAEAKKVKCSYPFTENKKKMLSTRNA